MTVAIATKTILIIDDNREHRQRWVEALTHHSPDYLVLEASDGRAGLAICREQKVDCVILDMDLPDMSGFEVLFTLNPDRHHPRIAVVVLTRLLSPTIHELTKGNGAQECVVKGHASVDMLDQAIRKAMMSVRETAA